MTLLEAPPITTPSVASVATGLQIGSLLSGPYTAHPPHVSIHADAGPSWLGAVETRVNELLGLPENWDTYGGRTLRVEHVANAIRLLSGLVDADSPAPAIVPTVRRGVQFDWDLPECAIEVRVDDDGGTVLIEGASGSTEGPISQDLLVELRRALVGQPSVA